MRQYTELVLGTEQLRSTIPYIRRSLSELRCYGPEVTEPIQRALAGLVSSVAVLDDMDTKAEACPACNGGAYENPVFVDYFDPCPVCYALDVQRDRELSAAPKWATERIPLSAYEVQACNF